VADPSALLGRRLYLCTADRPDLVPFLAACMRGGVDVVQLRDKVLDARPLLARAAAAAAVCADFGVPFILNDRPDLALACEGAGVHVGQDDTPPEVARRILGPERIVGLSTHAPAEWDAAAGVAAVDHLSAGLAAVDHLSAGPAAVDHLSAGLAAVDYLSAGPVSPTPTKPGRPGTGLEYVSYVAASAVGAQVPWFVTGGVTPETVPGMAAAGARRFVVVRYLTEAGGAGGAEAAARRLRAAIDSAVAGGVGG
jgi:thiamine-phosphate pyrophosphorylase